MTVSFQPIVDDLLAATGASRITLRLDTPGDNFPVVAEALAPGVASIREGRLDQRNALTARRLMETLDVLVQSDTLAADPPPPPELIQHYGTLAQMLGPIVADGVVIGWLSVHENRGPREWEPGEVAALRVAMARVQVEVGAAGAAGADGVTGATGTAAR